MTRPPIVDLVDRYCLKADTPISAEEVYDALRKGAAKKEKFTLDDVDDALDDNALVCYHHYTERYLPLRVYLRGARFRVRPMPEEIAAGTLIPGHRFLPFIPATTLPPDATLTLADGTAIPKRKICMPCRELPIFFSLFHSSETIEYMLTDDERNAQRISDGKDLDATDVFLTVYDMAEVYKTWDFRDGDSLLVTVADWLDGQLTIAYSPASRAAEEFCHYQAWSSEMDMLLEEAFNTIGPTTEVGEQLLYAYCHGSPMLLTSPGFHIGGHIHHSRNVRICYVGSWTILWRADEEPESAVIDQLGSRLKPATGAAGSLQEILTDITSSITEPELAAHMHDELFLGGTDLDRVYGRVEARLPPNAFYNDAQENAFYTFVEALWDDIGKAYNRFADTAHAPYRARALSIIEQQLDWSQQLDPKMVRGDDPDVCKEVLQFSQLCASLINIVDSMNIFSPGRNAVAAMPDAAEMMKTLDNAESMAANLFHSIRDRSETTAQPKLQVVGGEGLGDDEPAPVVQLKISLKHAQPPIWRRLLVPADYTLGDLHGVIQVAMDWSDSHLHNFVVNGGVYGPIDPSGGSDDVDEDAVMLLDLLDNDIATFAYVYDFGDYWEHEIVVEKVIAPSDAGADNLPRCIAGRRAAPPEDCGGMPGYLEILKQYDAAPGKAAWREWLGADFDPAAFAKADINAALAAWIDGADEAW